MSTYTIDGTDVKFLTINDETFMEVRSNQILPKEREVVIKRPRGEKLYSCLETTYGPSPVYRGMKALE